MIKVSEHQLQTAIMQYLRFKGWYCMRLNSGKYSVGEGRNKRFILGQDAGTPDICFGLNYGKYTLLAWIEVKSSKGKLTPLQEQFKKDAESKGICHIVARSVDDVERGINDYIQNL